MSSLKKSFILFDDSCREDLLPLTFTRPVALIRLGILTIREKWEHYLNSPCSFFTAPYLQEKYKLITGEENVFINGSVLPDSILVREIAALKPGMTLINDDVLIACNTGSGIPSDFTPGSFDISTTCPSVAEFFRLKNPWEIFLHNGTEIINDFNILTAGRNSAVLSQTNKIIAPENVFAEEGVYAEHSIINASTGPVYLGKDAEVMEGSIIRGPFALCGHSSLKMGAKIYGPTTIGPHSKVGGEVNNSIIFGYSNKAHDGFLGNSVIGEWCNLGADSNNSNLKNNYAPVKLWNYRMEKFINTGLQFCGLIMGDHSKCGINTMFNTGTVVGVSANIFGSGFPRNFIPSFSWGGAGGFSTYSIQKVLETVEIVMKRRTINLEDTDINILKYIYDFTSKYRKY